MHLSALRRLCLIPFSFGQRFVACVLMSPEGSILMGLCKAVNPYNSKTWLVPHVTMMRGCRIAARHRGSDLLNRTSERADTGCYMLLLFPHARFFSSSFSDDVC